MGTVPGGKRKGSEGGRKQEECDATIRRNFFLLVMWSVTIVSIAGMAALLDADAAAGSNALLIVISITYLVLNIAVTHKFLRR